MIDTSTNTFGFPSEFDTSEQKKTEDYGKRYALAIWNGWGGMYQYNERRGRFIELRKWREGLQSPAELKKICGVEGDKSFLNLDWTPISIIPKFVDVMTAMINNSLYKVQVNAVDKISTNVKDKEKSKMRATYLMKKLQDETGIPLVPNGMKVPESEEEINLYMDLNFKQSTEIAMELALDKIFKEIKFKDVRAKVVDDFITIKTGGIRVYHDANKQVKARYIDPVNLITPYTVKEDYSDITHAGELVWKTIGQIKSEAGDKFSEEQYYNIATSCNNQYGNLLLGGIQSFAYYNKAGSYPYYNFLIPCLDFQFLSINTDYFKTKKNKYGVERTFKSNADYKPNNPETKVFSKDRQDKYSGIYIIGADLIYGYGLAENMTRKKKNGNYSADTTLDFRLYSPGMRDMENKSMVERMIPYARQMHLAHLKLQQIQAASIPKGLGIDISGLQEVTIGKGNQKETMSVLEMEAIYRARGTFYYNRVNSDGSPMNGLPIQELENGLGKDVMSYIEIWKFNENNIRSMTGINESVDASTPSPEALVGIQKMAAAGAKNSIRTLTDALTHLVEDASDHLVLMIQDYIEYNKDNIEMALGHDVYDIIKLGANIPACEYAIYCEYAPDEEERAYLENQVSLAQQQKEIRPEDAMLIKSMKDVKQASQYMTQRRKAYQAELMKQSAAQSQAQAQAAAEAAKVAEDEKRTTAAAQAQIDIVRMEQEYDLKMKFEAYLSELKIKEIAAQGQWNLQIAAQNSRMQQTSDLTK